MKAMYLALLVLIGIALCLDVQGRKVLTHTRDGGKGDEESPTSNYNSFKNTFIMCPTVISDKKADSAEECITRCYEDERCTHWTWCPDDEPGCDVLPFGELSSSDPADPKTCILSYDPLPQRTANLIMDGPSVAWMGGFWTGGSSPGSSPTPSPEPEPEPKPSPEPAKSPKTSSPPGAGYSCNTAPNTLYTATSQEAQMVEAWGEVPSAEDCCSHCQQNENCNVWFYCYSDADSCTKWEGGDGTQYENEGKIDPGTCYLWYVPTLDGTALVSDDPNTPWASGYLTAN